MFFSVKPYWYFLFSLMLTLALAGLISLQDNVWWIACSVLILLAGLPHGAYDLVIMRARHRGTELAMMVLGYIALVLAALVLWAFQPFVLLASFIVYSAFHFGDSDFRPCALVAQVQLGRCYFGHSRLVLSANSDRLVRNDYRHVRCCCAGLRLGRNRSYRCAHACFAGQTIWRCGGGSIDLCLSVLGSWRFSGVHLLLRVLP